MSKPPSHRLRSTVRIAVALRIKNNSSRWIWTVALSGALGLSLYRAANEGRSEPALAPKLLEAEAKVSLSSPSSLPTSRPSPMDHFSISAATCWVRPPWISGILTDHQAGADREYWWWLSEKACSSPIWVKLP